MSAEHTPGKVIHDTRGYPNPDVRSESGRKIAVTWMVGSQPKTREAYIKRTEQDRANARRIVACWNACDGVETELLEQHPAPFSELRAERDRLHAANVELLEALKRIVSTVPAIADGGGFVVDHHSPDGEYMGTENIDPAWVIQEMASVAVNAIAKHGATS